MKKIALVLLLVSALFLTGCGPQKQTGTTGDQTSNQTEEKKSVFDSIKDAMSKSLSLQCDFTEKDTKVIAYIKGKMIRSDSEYQGTKSGVIIKENKMWVWSNKSKDGMVLDLTEPQKQQGTTSSEDVIAAIDKYKQNCRQTLVSDSLFTPPSDIKFQDLSQMFKNLGGSQ